MKELKVIKAWCDSQIEYYKQWESEKEYNDATNELRLLHTLSKMLDSAIEENQTPAGSLVFRGSNIKWETPDSED
jgi:hypothetical protein|nr:MAG TPA: hypothetical protein [Caudoviricetes sp.]